MAIIHICDKCGSSYEFGFGGDSHLCINCMIDTPNVQVKLKSAGELNKIMLDDAIKREDYLEAERIKNISSFVRKSIIGIDKNGKFIKI